MTNVAAVLKQEITRLARREARSLTKPLHKVTAGLRKSIAELKRENARARADIIRLLRKLPVSSVLPLAKGESSKVRFSAASVIAQRKRLGLSAEAFGKLIGVTGHTVYSWEQGKSRPRSAQVKAFSVVRGIGKGEVNARLQELSAQAPKGRKKSKQK
jgi:hypothetical protein